MANKIKIKRGIKANLPILSVGEQGLCTDTSEIFIGGSTGNIQLANKEYVDSQLVDMAINVKAFGAKGDGITDDTIAVQNAINTAQQKNKTVHFPKGTYLCNIEINLSL